MKERVRQMTRRIAGGASNRSCEDLRAYLSAGRATSGWRRPRSVFSDLDEWIRHRLRAIQLKQWKRGRTVYRELVARGLRRIARRRSRPTRADGGRTRRWPFTSPSQLACSTSWGFPGSARNLNFSNRRMRTRLSGGVGGERRANRRPLSR